MNTSHQATRQSGRSTDFFIKKDYVPVSSSKVFGNKLSKSKEVI